jgi:hypothetical protein
VTTANWVHDDPTILGTETFLRRVKREPNCFVVNATTAEYEIKENAITFEDDGLSIHSDLIRAEKRIPRDKIVPDWQVHTAIEFPADAARAGGAGGIHRAPVNGEHMGAAHALVQGPTKPGKPTRPERRQIRASIIDNHTLVPEDPVTPRPQ